MLQGTEPKSEDVRGGFPDEFPPIVGFRIKQAVETSAAGNRRFVTAEHRIENGGQRVAAEFHHDGRDLPVGKRSRKTLCDGTQDICGSNTVRRRPGAEQVESTLLSARTRHMTRDDFCFAIRTGSSMYIEEDQLPGARQEALCDVR